MPLPTPEQQLQTAIRYFRRDGLVLIKDRPGSVVEAFRAWAQANAIDLECRRRTLGRASHWELRAVPAPPTGAGDGGK